MTSRFHERRTMSPLNDLVPTSEAARGWPRSDVRAEERPVATGPATTPDHTVLPLADAARVACEHCGARDRRRDLYNIGPDRSELVCGRCLHLAARWAASVDRAVRLALLRREAALRRTKPGSPSTTASPTRRLRHRMSCSMTSLASSGASSCSPPDSVSIGICRK